MIRTPIAMNTAAIILTMALITGARPIRFGAPEIGSFNRAIIRLGAIISATSTSTTTAIRMARPARIRIAAITGRSLNERMSFALAGTRIL